MTKKILVSMLALFAIATTARAQVTINATNFPDDNFRNWLLAQEYGQDGKLTTTEIAAVTEMAVHGKSIKNLRGIEHFTALEDLWCHENQLTELDFSKNTKLTYLDCRYNKLTKVNVSKNTELETLDCDNNKLTELDVSKNTKLKNFYCSYNELTELKAPKNQNLYVLTCYGNKIKGYKMQELVESLPRCYGYGIYIIDTKYSNEGNVITKSQVAVAKGKGWTVYDKNGESKVEYAGSADPSGIIISSANFPDEKFRNFVSGTTIDTDKDGYLSDAEIAAVTSMNVSSKSIKNLKGIEFFTALTELFCNDNELGALDMSANTKLTSLNCARNGMASLNVSANTKLEKLYCLENQLGSLDVSKNTKLTTLSCGANKLTELNVSKNLALTMLSCHSNQIKGDKMVALLNSLPKVSSGKGNFYVINTKNSSEQNVITKSQVTIAKSKNWKVLDYNGGGASIEYEGSDDLIAINETNFPDEKFRSYVSSNYDKDKDGYLTDAEIKALTSINVNGKNIANLKGIEHFTAVTMLQCANNQLTELDLSANTKLIYLSCTNNQLKSLGLSKNTALQTLYCYNNQLAALDVSKNTALKTLSCYGNQIKGDKMEALVESLPTVSSGDFVVVNLKNSSEQNAITKAQVAVAKGKNWTVYDNNGGSKVEYEGSDTPTGLTAVESGQLTVDSWYSIDGKKLQGEPTKKGVYIRNGRKVIK